MIDLSQKVLAPVAVLVLWTFIIGFRMFCHRIAEMKRCKISPDSIALSQTRSARLKDSRASDNYNHLFEQPILFYVLSVTVVLVQYVPTGYLLMAWSFVILRVIHSIIQCTINNVMWRFSIFMVSYVLLGFMWGLFSWYLFTA
ncbi:MAPEG family protein [Thalassotalea ganghwensis]